ncbi:MAG: hypothetical protein IPN33_15075 [Saprospiraceae bacterium]|nr:hypothetical protein [Saprospiraceae bacterium]
MAMQIITVELLNDNALPLLQQLEQLHILRLVETKTQQRQAAMAEVFLKKQLKRCYMKSSKAVRNGNAIFN